MTSGMSWADLLAGQDAGAVGLHVSQYMKSDGNSTESPIVFHSAEKGELQIVGKAIWSPAVPDASSVELKVDWYEETVCGYKQRPGEDEADLFMLFLQKLGRMSGVKSKGGSPTTIFDGKGSLEVTFKAKEGWCCEIDLKDTAIDKAIESLRCSASSGVHRCWKLKGPRPAYKKLCEQMATKAKQPDQLQFNGSVNALLPGSIVFIRSCRSRPDLHNTPGVIIEPTHSSEPGHCLVGSLRGHGEKGKIRSVHRSNLYTDGTSMREDDFNIPRYRVLLRREAGAERYVYLLGPKDGKCHVSEDPEGQKVMEAEADEIKCPHKEVEEATKDQEKEAEQSDPEESTRPSSDASGESGDQGHGVPSPKLREQPLEPAGAMPGNAGDVPARCPDRKANLATVSQMRDHPLKISLEHRYPGSLNESTVTLHSPVDGEEKDVGRASWTSHFASNSGSVELEIDLRVADLRASGYKHKPADQVNLFSQFLIQGLGRKKQVRGNVGDAKFTTILDGYQQCSEDALMNIRFSMKQTIEATSEGVCEIPVVEDDAASAFQALRRSGERPHSAWHLKGTKAAVLKLCDGIASFMKANEPKMGAVPVLLPGCIMRMRSSGDFVVIIEPYPREHPDDCRVGTMNGEKFEMKRVHAGELFTDLQCLRVDGDMHIPKYKILFQRDGVKKPMYLLGPKDGMCQVALDREGQQVTYALPEEIHFDKSILKASKKKEGSLAPSAATQNSVTSQDAPLQSLPEGPGSLPHPQLKEFGKDVRNGKILEEEEAAEAIQDAGAADTCDDTMSWVLVNAEAKELA